MDIDLLIANIIGKENDEVYWFAQQDNVVQKYICSLNNYYAFYKLKYNWSIRIK